MLTALCGPILRCDNHSLASFKDRANPPTAPTAACFVPSAESSHLVPASRRQLLPGQPLSQVSNRARHIAWPSLSSPACCWIGALSSCQLFISPIEIINQMKPEGGVLSNVFLILWVRGLEGWKVSRSTSQIRWENRIGVMWMSSTPVFHHPKET